MFYIDNKYWIRKFYLADAEAIFDNVAMNHEHLKQWLGFIDDYQNISGAFKFIESCIEGYKNGTSFTLGIWLENDTNNKRHIGTFGLNWIEGQTAELGYWIAKDFSGKGIMYQAIASLLVYIKNNLPQIKTIVASIAVDNIPSRRLIEHLGFTLQPDIIPQAECLYGKWIDHVIYQKNVV